MSETKREPISDDRLAELLAASMDSGPHNVSADCRGLCGDVDAIARELQECRLAERYQVTKGSGCVFCDINLKPNEFGNHIINRRGEGRGDEAIPCPLVGTGKSEV